MTDEELERMRALARLAEGAYRSWDDAYAEDVPKLLDEIQKWRVLAVRIAYAVRGEAGGLEDGDLQNLPANIIAGNVVWAKTFATLRSRLRFAEMVLDRLNAEINGVPWREAARLSESLDGEPVTEPLAPPLDTGVQS